MASQVGITLWGCPSDLWGICVSEQAHSILYLNIWKTEGWTGKVNYSNAFLKQISENKAQQPFPKTQIPAKAGMWVEKVEVGERTEASEAGDGYVFRRVNNTSPGHLAFR